jgi:hypothetical protein
VVRADRGRDWRDARREAPRLDGRSENSAVESFGSGELPPGSASEAGRGQTVGYAEQLSGTATLVDREGRPSEDQGHGSQRERQASDAVRDTP